MPKRFSLDRYREVSAKLDHALELEGEQLSFWLASLRAEDASLAADVEFLLEEHRLLDREGFLKNPPEHRPEPAAGGHRTEVPRGVAAALSGSYRLDHELGHGGMATVYLADDLKHSRQVAIKIMRPELAAAIGKERFRREIEVAARLTHPHIVPVHDSGIASGHLYYVMPFISGESLRARLNRERRLSVDESLRLVNEIAGALGYAHQRGIVHRDIKPENVLLADDIALVADFGIARAVTAREAEESTTLESLTQSGIVIGTPRYIAPEQARGDDVDGRADIYSLACVLYEMLAGKPPFGASTIEGLLRQHLSAQPPALHEIRNDVPPSVVSAIAKALAKLPADRFATVREFADALGVDRIGAFGGFSKRLGRRTRQVAGAALVLGLMAIGGLARSLYVGLVTVDRTEEQSEGALLIRPLTTFVGTEWTGSWSPDGSQIAFMHTDGGSADISVMSVDGGQPHLIVTGPYDEHTPRWSPDGSKIAYLSDRGRGLEVFSMPVTGGAERTLAATNIEYLARWDGVYAIGATPWSPNGKLLLFSQVLPDLGMGISRVEVATGRLERLTSPPPGSEDLEPSWSFDGRWVAFSRWAGGRVGIWLMPAEGGEARPLLSNEHNNRGPAWRPDGSHIVFFSNRSGSYNLWDVEIEGGRLRQLTNGPGPDYLPVVSSRSQILFTNWNHQADLYWFELGAKRGEHVRLTFNTRENYGAEVAPGGDQIAYHSDRTGNNEIWRFDRSTGAERQLTDDPAEDVLPDWSPDGGSLVFLSNRAGSFQPWIMSAEGGDAHRLSDHVIPMTGDYAEGSTNDGPRWSPDGKLIGFSAPGEGGHKIWLVQPDGQALRPAPISGALRFDWYLDSHRIVYVRRAAQGAFEVYAANLETGREELLLRRPSAQVRPAPDGRSLAYVDAAGHFGMNLFRLPLIPPDSSDGLPRPAGKAEQLTDGGGIWHVHGGGWSPDGTGLVYTRDTDRGDIFLLDGYASKRAMKAADR